jgi:hypothetical protein
VRDATPLRQLRGASAALHVFISHPSSLEDLRAFLEQAECVVTRCQAHDLEVDLPLAYSEAQARRELDVYLATWQTVNRGVEVYVVDRDSVA